MDISNKYIPPSHGRGRALGASEKKSEDWTHRNQNFLTYLSKRGRCAGDLGICVLDSLG